MIVYIEQIINSLPKGSQKVEWRSNNPWKVKEDNDIL